MKRKLIIIVCVLVAAAALGCWWLTAPFRVVRQLNARYQRVQRGMNTNEVQAIMSYRGRWHTNGTYRGWDDTPPSGSERPNVGYAAAYSVSTFFLPITFEFIFDESGKVVGKHRYD